MNDQIGQQIAAQLRQIAYQLQLIQSQLTSLTTAVRRK
jgi:hypothetical protein